MCVWVEGVRIGHRSGGRLIDCPQTSLDPNNRFDRPARRRSSPSKARPIVEGMIYSF